MSGGEGLAAWLREAIRGDLAWYRTTAGGGNPDARELIARCEAELGILDAYESAVKRRRQEQADYGAWVRGEASIDRPQFDGAAPALIPGLEMAVRLLGTGYRHRDGYLEEWAP